jgi:hypothetical protein
VVVRTHVLQHAEHVPARGAREGAVSVPLKTTTTATRTLRLPEGSLLPTYLMSSMCGLERLQDRMSATSFSMPSTATSASQHTRDSRVDTSAMPIPHHDHQMTMHEMAMHRIAEE